MEGISGKVAIVTGGANGIGAGVAQKFVAEGVKVVVADVAEREGSDLAKRLGPSCRFVRTDLRSDSDLDKVVTEAVAAFGGIDFLINVACSYADKGVDSDREAWHAGFDVNLIGHVMLLRRALEFLRRSDGASVVNFASASGHIAQAGRWIYPATKAAVEQVTRSQAMDLADDGIRVNAVLPGWVAKSWQATASEEVRERYNTLGSRFHMLGRLGQSDEVAEAVLFLCSRHARFVTGTCLRVDGGYTALGPQGREVILPSSLRAAAGSFPGTAGTTP